MNLFLFNEARYHGSILAATDALGESVVQDLCFNSFKTMNPKELHPSQWEDFRILMSRAVDEKNAE